MIGATPKTEENAVMESPPGASFHEAGVWHTIRWHDVHRTVRRLQARIVKATQEGHWQKLIDLGMILEEPTGYIINPLIVDLAKREQSHAVVTRIIHASSALVMKPIFNSQLEYQIYTVLLELFPHHLVFPNIALQAIFQYERMKALLEANLFGYFLRASVDFCITSTVTYLPILTFEVDSSYHDLPEHQLRDEKKDRIFALGGVPLLRLRIFGQPSAEAIRHDIIEAVRTWEKTRLPLLVGDHKLTVNLEQEIDFDTFGQRRQL